MSRLIV